MDGSSEVGSRNRTVKGKDSPRRNHKKRQKDKPLIRKPLILGKLPEYRTIGRTEKINLAHAIKRPLSGYIGGNSQAGYWVSRLTEEWCDAFRCRYAVPCNSATSGLLAACMATDIGDGDIVWVSDYTMSATAACATFLGADVELIDIDPVTFCMERRAWEKHPSPKAIIVTNLFGLAADLHALRNFCDEHKIILIEDNAQAPFAMLDGKYTGTIGHIGVFSLNVHKHIQSGEGGVVVTDDAQLAHRLDCAINHGELMRTNPHLGLNLRMTEPTAAIASAQLKKGPFLVRSRMSLAYELTSYFNSVPFVEPPTERGNGDHVYYLWAGKIKGSRAKDIRRDFLAGLAECGVPFRMGYSIPLHRLFAPAELHSEFPVTNEMEDERLFVFEICAHDPKAHHLRMMKRCIEQEAGKVIEAYG